MSGAFWASQIVIGWLTYQMTRSPLLTSLALGLDSLPILLAGPIGGVLADTWDRGKLLAAVSVYQSVVTAAFSVAVVLNLIETWHIFAFVLAMGLSWAVSDPTRGALIPSIVPRQNLVNAFALNHLAFNATRLVVPAVAGLAVAWLGAGHTLLLGAALYLGAATIVAAIDAGNGGQTETRRAPALARFVEAARYVKGEPQVLMLIVLGALPTLLLMPYVHTLMPVYASEVFDVGPAGLGLLMSGIGVGGILGTVVLASMGDLRHRRRVIIFALALTVAAMAAFSRSTSVVLSLPILMVLSSALVTYWIVVSATLQEIVPDKLRGRVYSLFAMASGLFPLGTLLSGGIAQLLGAPSATLIGAAALAIFAIALSLRLRRIPSLG